MTQVSLHLNGQPVKAEVDASTLLVDWLRIEQGLTGTHIGCDTSQCGACTVLLDGKAVKSCSMLAVQADGHQVTTIEGLANLGPHATASRSQPSEGAESTGRAGSTRGGQLHPVQDAFIACHGLQCGFCTPGMVMSAVCLLMENPRPSDAQIGEALEGNLCRCTGYVNIVASVRLASETMAGGAR